MGMQKDRPRVVVVGGGFGGLSTAKALRNVPADVTLLDRTNHHLFQPLLYQVAAGVLSAADIAVPTRFALRRHENTTVLLADVESVDLSAKVVRCDGGRLRVRYDYLILAPGARHSYFGHSEWESNAPGLKTLDDALEIRRRFLTAFEEAEKTDDPAERAALMTFVIIGGGPTGVELAGVLPTIARHGFKRDFRRIDPRRSGFILLEGGPRLLPTFPDSLSTRACTDLEALGVICRTRAVVTNVTPRHVFVGDERIPTRTVFWAAGNAASPLVRTLGVPVDRAGRALVMPDLTIPGHPNVFIIGDAAAVAIQPAVAATAEYPGTPRYVPGLAAAANQMGAYAASAIAARLRDESPLPFRYRNRGALAVIGRNRAVADFGSVRVTGRFAFVTWLLVHLIYLAGFRNRVSVALEWLYAYFTYRPGARLITRDGASRDSAAQSRSEPLRNTA